MELETNNDDMEKKIKDSFLKFIPEESNSMKKLVCSDFEEKSTMVNEELFLCKVSSSDDGIEHFHSKLHLLTLFFIDGASFIEYEDPKWEIFYL